MVCPGSVAELVEQQPADFLWDLTLSLAGLAYAAQEDSRPVGVGLPACSRYRSRYIGVRGCIGAADLFAPAACSAGFAAWPAGGISRCLGLPCDDGDRGRYPSESLWRRVSSPNET